MDSARAGGLVLKERFFLNPLAREMFLSVEMGLTRTVLDIKSLARRSCIYYIFLFSIANNLALLASCFQERDDLPSFFDKSVLHQTLKNLWEKEMEGGR